MTVVKRFDANGAEITPEQWEKIQAEYFPLPSKNEHQGLDNPILVNNYSLENVKYLKQGEFVFDVMTPEMRKKIAA